MGVAGEGTFAGVSGVKGNEDLVDDIAGCLEDDGFIRDVAIKKNFLRAVAVIERGPVRDIMLPQNLRSK